MMGLQLREGNLKYRANPDKRIGYAGALLLAGIGDDDKVRAADFGPGLRLIACGS